MANRFGIPTGTGHREERGAPGDLRALPGTALGPITQDPGEFGRGLERGGGTVAAGAARAAGAVARAAGRPDLAEMPENYARDVEEEHVAPNAPRVGSIFDIRYDTASHLVRDSRDYLKQLGGSQVPVMGTVIAGAAAGGAAAGLGGAALGGGAVSAIQQAGEAAGAIEGDLGRPLEQDEAQAALVAGGLGGSLDVLPVLRAGRVLGLGGPLKAQIRRSLLGRSGREALAQAGVEGGTEALQQVIQRGARRFVNENFEMLGPEGAREILDAAAAGAIMGAGMGAVTGALSKPASEEQLLEEDLQDIEADEQLRAMERDRLVDAARTSGQVSEKYLNQVAGEEFVDEALLDELRQYVPDEFREQSDLDYQGFSEAMPSAAVEMVLDKLRDGQELSRREATAAASALQSMPAEEVQALAVRQDNQNPRTADLLNRFLRAREGLAGEQVEQAEQGQSGDLGSSLTQLEGQGDTLVDYFSVKTRHPRQGEWVGDKNTGGFFRDSEHLSKSLASLNGRDNNTVYEAVPARVIVEGMLKDQGLSLDPAAPSEGLDATVPSRAQVLRAQAEESEDPALLAEAEQAEAEEQGVQRKKNTALGMARQFALNELEARVSDTQDALTREQLDRVRTAARAYARTGQMPDGTSPGVARAAAKLTDDPLSIFEGRSAVVPTAAPAAFVGDDPLGLTAEDLRPELTREQKRQRARERAEHPVGSKEREAVDERFAKRRRNKAIVRSIKARADGSKRGPNAREFLAHSPEGRPVYIFAPGLVRAMVRKQRRLNGRAFGAFITPQEVIDGFTLGLAELRKQGFLFGNNGVVADNGQLPPALHIWEQRSTKTFNPEATDKKGDPVQRTRFFPPNAPTNPAELSPELRAKVSAKPSQAGIKKGRTVVGKSASEPITWGEIRVLGAARMKQRMMALGDAMQSTEQQIDYLRQQLASPAVDKASKAHYRKQLIEQHKLRELAPDLIDTQMEMLRSLSELTPDVSRTEQLDEMLVMHDEAYVQKYLKEQREADRSALGETSFAIEEQAAETEGTAGEDEQALEEIEEAPDDGLPDFIEMDDYLDYVQDRVDQGEYTTQMMDPFAGEFDPNALNEIAEQVQQPLPPAHVSRPDVQSGRGGTYGSSPDGRGFAHMQQRERGEGERLENLGLAHMREELEGIEITPSETLRGEPQRRRAREQADLSGAELHAATQELGESPSHKQDKARVKAWAKQLNLPEGTKLMSTAEVLQVLRERGDVGRIHRIRNGSLNGLSIGNAVWVHPALEGQARLEVLAHELGHVIATATAPHNSDAVYDAWVQWRKRQERPGTSLQDVAQSKQAFFTAMRNFGRLDSTALAELNAQERAYVLDFEEWFADQVARHLAGEPSPVAEVRTWVDRFLDKMKELFGIMRGQGYRADPSVVEFLTRWSYRNDQVSARVREAAGAFAPGAQRQSLYAAIIAEQPGSHAANMAVEQFLETADQDTANVLRRAFASDTKVRREIMRIIKPVDALQAWVVGNNVDRAVAIGLQLWAHGELQVGARTEGLLGRLRDSIFEALGAVPDSDQVAQALQAVRSHQGSTFVVSRVRSRTALQRTAQASKQLWDKWLGPLVDRIAIPAYSRMENSDNPFLVELGRMFHNPAGQGAVGEGYLAAKSRNTNRFLDHLHRAFGDKPSAELLQEVHEAMQRGQQAASPEAQQVQRRLRGVLNELYSYMQRAGQLSSEAYRQDYYPRVWNAENLQEVAQEWRANAADPAYAAEWAKIASAYQQTLTQYNDAVATAASLGDPTPQPGRYEQRALDMETRFGSISNEAVIDTTFRSLIGEYGAADLNLMQGVAGHNPFVAARGHRVLDFLMEGPHADFFHDQLSKDPDHTLRAYVESAVKRTELDRKGGIMRVRRLIEEAIRSGASAADIKTASDFTEAMQGTIGHETAAWVARLAGQPPPEPGTVINPKLQTSQAVIMLWQNMRVLALAGFTSLADPVGVLVRGGGMDEATASLRALRNGSYARDVARGLGIISEYSINEALGGIYGSSYMVGKTKAWSERFFKWTGLELITRTTRTMATGSALQFLKHHTQNPDSNSQRFLDELALEASDVHIGQNGEVEVLTRAEISSLYAARATDPTANEEIERDQRVRAAINKFVDEAVLRPTAATRPIWASDPHFALLFHLKSFIYTFHSQILRRVWREGVEHGNMTPLLLLTVYVPFMIAADVLRDMARHGPGGDPKKEDWGVMDWTQHGVERAGLPGLASFLLDAQQDQEWGGIGIESALGPTVDSLMTLVDDVALGDSEQAYRGLLKQLPGQNTPLVDLLR